MSEPTADASAFSLPPGVASERPPRPAATIVVVRPDAAGAIEVLLSRRAERGDHNSGAWVFPGGTLDGRDASARAYCAGLDDLQASRRLLLDQGGLDFFIAAVRECFEESGLLFGYGTGDAWVDLDGADKARLAPWRGALHRCERTMAELCASEGIRLAVDKLHYLSHWLTPAGRPKRFDTRFFLAEAPPWQTAVHDGTELVEQLWISPAEALARSRTLKLLTPTQKTLETLTRFDDVASLMSWAASPRVVELVMPRVGTGAQGLRPVLPDEPAWAELGRIDPSGRGDCSYDIVPGTAVRLSERVIRVTAGNGSAMTGPGTNTYLVGDSGSSEWAVIDPGPALDGHVEAILAAAPGPITRILVTHTHTDHSPATAALKARTGATVLGLAPRHREWQDATFVADTTLSGGERLALGPTTHLSVIHTPGHAGNHLCYLLEEEKLLFTGDHVMQASTVVINPPDGDMAAYIASLRSLLALDLDWLAPGHGFLMARPRAAMEAIIAHRLKREGKVVSALQDRGPAALVDLLPVVYADVPPRLHPVALRSLSAHLLKLRDDGRATEAGGLWALQQQAGASA
ncbi:MAG TPA: MBL fold metallo-hydrolase [Caldimonas sp.]|jgi:glyoxylase-like metal-dependent hydrolase (beta-lactamase superfamily II)/8-oxo-dGTP pyrophosphatase MutT (NUDIX family)|nr:MBL fold metallo-hydrolase [Caldimonas sp.]HEX2542326.1 MBL fold metallo-hydrolase [Caldimonas sp.]